MSGWHPGAAFMTATRRIQFAAGHRVYRHESKCAHIHGHNYVAMVTARAIDQERALDDLGRVVDFSVMKAHVGGWIEDKWDHGMILWSDDPLVDVFATMEGGRHKRFIAPFNPTAEEMAAYLLYVVGPMVLDGTGVRLVKVELWETENCRAEVRL